MAFFLSLSVISLIAFFWHLWNTPRFLRTRVRLIELFLLYQLVFNVGITSLVAFLGLTFMSDYMAHYLNWPIAPFEQELGSINLAFGVLGLLCIWFRQLFWVATILGFSIWILSDGIRHLYLTPHNYAGNVGIMLYTDLIIPVLLLVLLFLYRKGISHRATDEQLVPELDRIDLF